MPEPVKEPVADPSKAEPVKKEEPVTKEGEPKPIEVSDEIKKQISDAAIAEFQKTIAPPEAYDLKGPDGKELPKDFVERTTAIARASGLSQKQAEAVVPFISEEVASRMDAIATENEPGKGSAWLARDAEWRKQALAAPDVAGSEEKLLAKAERGRQVLTHLKTINPEAGKLEEFLDQTGFGSHPAVVEHFAALGKLMKEADFIKPPEPESKKDTTRVEDRMFPSTAKKE